MTKILVDQTPREKLHQLAESLELCDETGRVLARVIPEVDLSEYEPWEPEISEQELQRIERCDKWYTTAEVLAHLKSLEKK